MIYNNKIQSILGWLGISSVEISTGILKLDEQNGKKCVKYIGKTKNNIDLDDLLAVFTGYEDEIEDEKRKNLNVNIDEDLLKYDLSIEDGFIVYYVYYNVQNTEKIVLKFMNGYVIKEIFNNIGLKGYINTHEEPYIVVYKNSALKLAEDAKLMSEYTLKGVDENTWYLTCENKPVFNIVEDVYTACKDLGMSKNANVEIKNQSLFKTIQTKYDAFWFWLELTSFGLFMDDLLNVVKAVLKLLLLVVGIIIAACIFLLLLFCIVQLGFNLLDFIFKP